MGGRNIGDRCAELTAAAVPSWAFQDDRHDLACTELTFGFVTALDIATEALDRLHTTAESHDRVMILEVMGRNTGWIALHSGLAGGADVILIPEIPFTTESVAAKVSERDQSGSLFSIIVVSEGALEQGHDLIYQDLGDKQAARVGRHWRTCGRSRARNRQGCRCVVLATCSAAGPDAFDRMLQQLGAWPCGPWPMATRRDGALRHRMS